MVVRIRVRVPGLGETAGHERNGRDRRRRGLRRTCRVAPRARARVGTRAWCRVARDGWRARSVRGASALCERRLRGMGERGGVRKRRRGVWVVWRLSRIEARWAGSIRVERRVSRVPFRSRCSRVEARVGVRRHRGNTRRCTRRRRSRRAICRSRVRAGRAHACVRRLRAPRCIGRAAPGGRGWVRAVRMRRVRVPVRVRIGWERHPVR